MVLSSSARELIQRLMAEARYCAWPEAPWLHEHAKRLYALPVGLDMWSWWFLAPVGEVILVEEGCDVEMVRYTERVKVVSALVWASEKYPELRDVFPQRESGAVDCRCLEVQLLAERKILCSDCGGLGWLPGDRG